MRNETCEECRSFPGMGYYCPIIGRFCDPNNEDPCEFFEKPFGRRPTNGDVIRNMDTSGLIDVIVCPYPDKVCIHRNMRGYACKCCKRDWLNAQAESGSEDEK